MKLEEYIHYDGTDLAALVAKGEVTAHELAQLALQRIEQQNPKVNAVVSLINETLEEQINNLDPSGPFAGVPFLAKDLKQGFKGRPMTMGSKALKHQKAKEHGEFLEKLLSLGSICLGHTNTPELGLKGVTEPEAYGPTRNPWNHSLTSGGSSGGSAASVASRMVPFAGAGDGGGSIRIPASCTGLIGLKPTRGRLIQTQSPIGWDGAVTEGVITRSVRDSFKIFKHCLPREEQKLFENQINEANKPKRIAFTTVNPISRQMVRPDVLETIHEAASWLEQQGHEVQEINFELDGPQAAISYMTMYFGQVSLQIEQILNDDPSVKYKNFEDTTKLLHQLGKKVSALDYCRAKYFWHSIERFYDQLFDDYDLILTPVMNDRPLPHHSFDPSPLEKSLMKAILKLGAVGPLLKTNLVEKLAMESLQKLPYTFTTNLSGHPAIAIPWRSEEQGPIGLHFIAPKNAEAQLIKMAFEIESKRGLGLSI